MRNVFANIERYCKIILQLLPEACEAFENEHLGAVKANILLLMGELVSQLKVNAITHLPTAVEKVISLLQQEECLSR